MNEISRRKIKRRNRTSKIWVSSVVILMVGVFSVCSYMLRAEEKQYEERQARLDKELQEEEERAEKLQKEEEYRQTTKYVEDYAHNRLGLIYPGEIIFKSRK